MQDFIPLKIKFLILLILSILSKTAFNFQELVFCPSINTGVLVGQGGRKGRPYCTIHTGVPTSTLFTKTGKSPFRRS